MPDEEEDEVKELLGGMEQSGCCQKIVAINIQILYQERWLKIMICIP